MNQFNDWKNNLDRFFGQDFWGDFEGIMKPAIPAINLYQYDNELLCFVNIPGMNHPKNVDVLVDHSTLTLTGKIEINHRGGHQIKSEIADGAFERSIELPFPVRHDKVEATYKHGLLIVQMHRYISDSTRQRPITIRHLEDE
ncbi:Hsp20/alpha crystallin family protein [Halobacillus karajensis]|uniref:Hsp20/alpha crystallin family protein n=1 Tax=Halobacillus karajensis TaxID=195088 RepID=A0A024P4A7_9BACI|nr:Hsp20/alpha crystallin family protein [Halobacillus karajensis]CDQ20631.1 Hsp20/alpha crystallin family protein [Halobacillus karajensis]CDQ23899.1 Hsp20/alpha crystallin family protein [Halobacillus karajensis]CDQ27377.1 Hsp20/alpha crystallin family protein [Halobacillus karajensis]